MILANTDIVSWMKLCAALTNDNVTSEHVFTAELFYAEATTS
jgi:hypothetical protein